MGYECGIPQTVDGFKHRSCDIPKIKLMQSMNLYEPSVSKQCLYHEPKLVGGSSHVSLLCLASGAIDSAWFEVWRE